MMMVVAAFLNLIERYGAMAAWPMGMDGQSFMGACTRIPKDVRGVSDAALEVGAASFHPARR